MTVALIVIAILAIVIFAWVLEPVLCSRSPAAELEMQAAEAAESGAEPLADRREVLDDHDVVVPAADAPAERVVSGDRL